MPSLSGMTLEQLEAAVAHARAGKPIRPGAPDLAARIAMWEAKMAEVAKTDPAPAPAPVVKVLALADKIQAEVGALDDQIASLTERRKVLSTALAFVEKYPEAEAVLHTLAATVPL